MPDRITTAPVLEYMSERVPEAKVVSNRMSGDCAKQSHAIDVKLKHEGSKYAVRKRGQIVHGLVNALMTSQDSSSESGALLELLMQQECMILILAVCLGYHLFAFVVQYSTCMTAVTTC